jgi:hypothetical protein
VKAGAIDGQSTFDAASHPPTARAGVAMSGCKEASVRIEPLIVLTGRVHDSLCLSMLLDSGATSNFVSASYAVDKSLPVRSLASPLTTNLADGTPLV